MTSCRLVSLRYSVRSSSARSVLLLFIIEYRTPATARHRQLKSCCKAVSSMTSRHFTNTLGDTPIPQGQLLPQTLLGTAGEALAVGQGQNKPLKIQETAQGSPKSSAARFLQLGNLCRLSSRLQSRATILHQAYTPAERDWRSHSCTQPECCGVCR